MFFFSLAAALANENEKRWIRETEEKKNEQLLAYDLRTPHGNPHLCLSSLTVDLEHGKFCNVEK